MVKHLLNRTRQKWQKRSTVLGSAGDEYPLYIFLDSFNAGKAKVVNGKVLPNYVLPEYKEWLKFMNRLYREGIMDQEYLVNTKPQMWEKIATGKVGAFYHFWSLQEFLGLKGKREDLVAMDPPLHPDGSKAGNLNQYPVRHWIAITKKAKNPQKIVDMMDWALSDEGGVFVHAGLQGMDYNIIDGKVQIKPERKGKSCHGALSPLEYRKTKIEDLSRQLETIPGDNRLQHLHLATGWNFDEITMLAPSFPELADYDLQSQRDEFRDKAIMGAINIDAEWDNFVAKWRKSGGDEWIRLHTQWYNTRK
jgi:putative aldouronate transport system substrate-binding protein